MRRDTEAASSALAFLAAGTLFLASAFILLQATEDRVPGKRGDDAAATSLDARNLLELLTGSPGIPSSAWDNANHVWVEPSSFRPGLAGPSGALDATRMCSLEESDVMPDNGILNYTETRSRLGLDASRQGFRLEWVDDPADSYALPCWTDGVFGASFPTGVAVQPAAAVLRFDDGAANNEPETATFRVYVFPA